MGIRLTLLSVPPCEKPFTLVHENAELAAATVKAGALSAERLGHPACLYCDIRFQSLNDAPRYAWPHANLGKRHSAVGARWCYRARVSVPLRHGVAFPM